MTKKAKKIAGESAVKLPTKITKKQDLLLTSANAIPIELIALPKGTSIDEYKGYKRWSLKRWAWEFLRRNQAFRSRCHSLESLTGNKRSAAEVEIARDFGLKNFKHCDAPFGKPGEGLQPSFNAIAYWYKVEDNKKRVVRVGMRQDQMIIRFDVRPVLKDKNALNDQLLQAKKALEWHIKEICKLEPKATKSRGRNIADDLRYLRMLDLKNSKFGSATDIYAALHPDDSDAMTKKLTGSSEALRDKFRNTYPAAEALAERGYLTLALASKKSKAAKK